eukprot:1373663-Pyramimonas_sp.AAC.1
MLDKHKLHVGTLTSVTLNHLGVEEARVARVESDTQADYLPAERVFDINMASAPSASTACDLQIVRLGAGAETYATIEAQFASVGCPHFSLRAPQDKDLPWGRCSTTDFDACYRTRSRT